MDGGSDTLRAATTWDSEDDGRLSVKQGDSYILFVEWEPGKPVRSESIQPFGAATTRPQSPHHTDQARMFVAKKLKPVHFWHEDALANARRRSVVESNCQTCKHGWDGRAPFLGGNPTVARRSECLVRVHMKGAPRLQRVTRQGR